jgi:hypothetical protein
LLVLFIFLIVSFVFSFLHKNTILKEIQKIEIQKIENQDQKKGFMPDNNNIDNVDKIENENN